MAPLKRGKVIGTSQVWFGGSALQVDDKLSPESTGQGLEGIHQKVRSLLPLFLKTFIYIYIYICHHMEFWIFTVSF